MLVFMRWRKRGLALRRRAHIWMSEALLLLLLLLLHPILLLHPPLPLSFAVLDLRHGGSSTKAEATAADAHHLVEVPPVAVLFPLPLLPLHDLPLPHPFPRLLLSQLSVPQFPFPFPFPFDLLHVVPQFAFALCVSFLPFPILHRGLPRLLLLHLPLHELPLP